MGLVKFSEKKYSIQQPINSDILMKKILKYLLLIIIGMAVGLLLGNYRWDYESQEQYCHKCGLTQVIEKEDRKSVV